jgi:hypothetical protein
MEAKYEDGLKQIRRLSWNGFNSRQREMAGSCESGNEHSGFKQSRESLELLSKYYVLKKDSASCIYVVS